MINAEALYSSKRFEGFLRKLARKAAVESYEDFKQDVFFEIAAEPALDSEDCARIAKRVQQRYWRARKKSRDEEDNVLEQSYIEEYNEGPVPLDVYFKMSPSQRLMVGSAL